MKLLHRVAASIAYQLSQSIKELQSYLLDRHENTLTSNLSRNHQVEN
jgi:hypothetical protein